MNYFRKLLFHFENKALLVGRFMQTLLILTALLFTTSVFADHCPETLKSDTDISEWSQVNMTELNYPATFISARYITSFGVMNGLVLCDYVDQNQMPFYLMSNNAYADPNPNRSKKSIWIAKSYPFSYLLCAQSAQDCQF